MISKSLSDQKLFQQSSSVDQIQSSNIVFFKGDPCMCAFEVKFYPPDPSALQEDITRWVSEHAIMFTYDSR